MITRTLLSSCCWRDHENNIDGNARGETFGPDKDLVHFLQLGLPIASIAHIKPSLQSQSLVTRFCWVYVGLFLYPETADLVFRMQSIPSSDLPLYVQRQTCSVI